MEYRKILEKTFNNFIRLFINILLLLLRTIENAEKVYKSVKYAIKTAGPGGGFIVSPANMHPAVKVQNLKSMVEATKKSQWDALSLLFIS